MPCFVEKSHLSLCGGELSPSIFLESLGMGILGPRAWSYEQIPVGIAGVSVTLKSTWGALM